MLLLLLFFHKKEKEKEKEKEKKRATTVRRLSFIQSMTQINFQIVSKYSKMVFSSFTFMMDPTLNLMRGPHHKYERKKYNFSCYESSYELFQEILLTFFIIFSLSVYIKQTNPRFSKQNPNLVLSLSLCLRIKERERDTKKKKKKKEEEEEEEDADLCEDSHWENHHSRGREQ